MKMLCSYISTVSSRKKNLIATALGAALGFGLRYGIDGEWGHHSVSSQTYIAFGVAFIGDCYTSLLKSLLIPIVIPAVLIAFRSLDMKTCVRVGRHFFIYCAITTIVSIIGCRTFEKKIVN